MTGQAERSTKKKQPSRSKARGWSSPKEQSNVGTPEAEPSWTSWKTQALEAEPSWTPWQTLATPWKIGHHGANLWPTRANRGQLGAILAILGDNLAKTWANLELLGAILGPTWGQLGPTWINLGQHGPKAKQIKANLASTWSQLGPT